MPLTYSDATKLFESDRITDLGANPEGQRFLKLRSLSRTEHLERLFQFASLEKPDVGTKELLKKAFEAAISNSTIEKCIRAIYSEERQARIDLEAALIDQLYKLQIFNWGGLHQNSLEKTIVDNYVKKITKYDQLCDSIDNELHTSLKGYVLCSWYNHWTSIIIEDIFKDNPAVLPAVGLVKKIDFFVKDIPFDLKVTYLPEGYVSDMRRKSSLRPELTLLKQIARAKHIPFTEDLAAAHLLQDLWFKVSDHPDADCRSLIKDLGQFRSQLVNEIISSPVDLIQWLYEQQGVRRFDAANRLFLVLVDERNYFDSWKLKRAKPLLETSIRDFLGRQKIGKEISFHWQDGNDYKVIADLLVVKHPRT